MPVVSRRVLGKLLGRTEEARPSEYILRLRGRKQEVAESIEQRKAAAKK